MGQCCATQPGAYENTEVEKDLRAAAADLRNINKLLLLGAGGSGKSTIFKQLQRVYGTGFTNKERSSFVAQIFDQIIDQMQLLIAKCLEHAEMDPAKYGQLKISGDSQRSADFIMRLQVGGTEVTEEIANHIKLLWRDPAIKEGFENRARFCVVDSSSYFFDHVDRIAARDYLPNDNDLLYTRHRTTGMTEKQFEIKGTILNIVDVGGQRSERRKWIHCFEGVTAVIFVASLSCYDEVLYEDETVNVMHESLDVFDRTVNSHWFKDTPFILFLNKSDLFAEKIHKTDLRVCFEQYERMEPVDETSLNYIRQVFEGIPKDQTKQLYTHVTCATDENNIERVFIDVQHIIINVSLQENGIV